MCRCKMFQNTTPYRSHGHRFISGAMALVFVLSATTPSFAKNFSSWEDLDTSRQQEKAETTYQEVLDVGEACAESFGDSRQKTPYLALTGQLYVLPEQFDQNFQSIQSRKFIQHQIETFSPSPVLLGELERESTQVYLNQLLYNWKLQSKIFRGSAKINLGNIGSWSEVKLAEKISDQTIASQKNIPNAIDPAELQKHIATFNGIIQSMNQTCSQANTIYSELMNAYNHSEKQDPTTNTKLTTILGPKEAYTFVDGGIKGAIRKRIQELRQVTTQEASFDKALLSQTMFGKMYSIDTQLKQYVGEYNTVSCVEYGKQLQLLPTDHQKIWNILGNAYGRMDWEYQKSLQETLDTFGEEDATTVLKNYIQTNPTSIQMALVANPSKDKALAVCDLVHDLQSSNLIKENIVSMLSPIAMITTIASMGSASPGTMAFLTYSALALNAYFIGTSVMDLVASYELEQRLQGTILAGQIDAEVGNTMIQSAQLSRPFSYINLGLAGLSAAALTTRAMQISKIRTYQQYLNAKGGSTPKQFASAENIFWGKQIKTYTLTKSEISNIANKLEPKGVPIKSPLSRDHEFYSPINNNGPIAPVKPTTKTSYTYSQMLKETKISPSTASKSIKMKPTIQNSPMARMEIEPDVVPMPLEPDIIVTPVIPDFTDSPVASVEQFKKDMEELAKTNKSARAETVIENDLNETDQSIIDEINLIGNGQGLLAAKARDWLNKHIHHQETPLYQNSKLSETSEIGISKHLNHPIHNEFFEIEAAYEKMQEELEERTKILKIIEEDNLIADADLKLLIKNHFDIDIENPTNNEYIDTYNKINELVHLANLNLIKTLKTELDKHGFKAETIKNKNGSHGLQITPTPQTKFYHSLVKYTKGITEKPDEFYTFIFNPLSLHILVANAAVLKTKVEFGLSTVENMILNEMGTTELHEIRHLYFHLLRKNRVSSVYHQTYLSENGDLNTTRAYKHHISAEEIFAYSNDLKEEIALTRKMAEYFPNEPVDFEGIEQIGQMLNKINFGILRSSHDFMMAIKNKSYVENPTTMGDSNPTIEIELSSGQSLQKDFVADSERKLFMDYLMDKTPNKGTHLDEILEYMYQEQQKLNYLAYNQIVILNALNKSIIEYYEIQNKLDATYDKHKNSSTIPKDELQKYMNVVRSNLRVDQKVNDILSMARYVYQLSKENSNFFPKKVHKMDEKFWPLVVIEPFSSPTAKPKQFDESFLDHLNYHVEDPSESRQNPLVLFRGISTFYKNSSTTQNELEVFTRWIVENFQFAPFWGKNKHGIEWGTSYMQMWPKSSFGSKHVSLQFDVIFMVGEDHKPYVVIKIPRTRQERLYAFDDLVKNLAVYIHDETLLPGKICPVQKYFNFATGAQPDQTDPTSWKLDYYEDIPALNVNP